MTPVSSKTTTTQPLAPNESSRNVAFSCFKGYASNHDAQVEEFQKMQAMLKKMREELEAAKSIKKEDRPQPNNQDQVRNK